MAEPFFAFGLRNEIRLRSLGSVLAVDDRIWPGFVVAEGTPVPALGEAIGGVLLCLSAQLLPLRISAARFI